VADSDNHFKQARLSWDKALYKFITSPFFLGDQRWNASRKPTFLQCTFTFFLCCTRVEETTSVHGSNLGSLGCLFARGEARLARQWHIREAGVALPPPPLQVLHISSPENAILLGTGFATTLRPNKPD